jgi:phosphate transport system substrate-binding protein
MKRTALAIAAMLAALSPAATGWAAEIRIVGTGDGLELLAALGAAYSADNPGTSVIVPPSIGSGGGIAAVGQDKEILGRIARPLTDSEKATGLIETPVFRLPIAIYVHPTAKVKSITSKQLAAIYAGEIKTWKEVGGADLKIKVVRREDIDSSLRVLRASMPGWSELKITEKSKTAVTTQDSVDSVVSTEGAIGFGPYTRALEPTLMVLKIDGEHPTDQGYPSAVTVSFIHKETTVTPVAKSMLQFAKSNKAKTLLAGMGGVPVTK